MIPRLGLVPSRPDSRTLKIEDFIAPDFAVPEAFDLTFPDKHDFDPLGNLDVGNCAFAGPGHKVRWADARAGRPVRVETAEVIDEYQRVAGYVPGVESTDNGAMAIDVLRHWRKTGLFGTRIEAFAAVNYMQPQSLKKAAFLLGGVFLCLALPKHIQGKDTWEVGKDGFSFWGNHLVWMDGASTVNSWGERILLAPGFVERHAFEAWAVVLPDDVDGRGRAFSGLDRSGLLAAVAQIA